MIELLSLLVTSDEDEIAVKNENTTVPRDTPKPDIQLREENKGDRIFINTSANDRFYFNRKKVESSGDGLIKVWTKTELLASARNRYVPWLLKEMQSRKLATEGYDRYSYKFSRLEIDCKRDKFRLLSAVDYDLDGRLLTNVEIEEARSK